MNTTRANLEAPTPRSQPTLQWQDADGRAHTHLVDRVMIVGSNPDADVAIAEPTVSRVHAELEPMEDGLWVRDLGSKNGTYVDQIRVGRARVTGGASVRFGSAVATVRYGDAKPRVDVWPSDQFGPLFGGTVVMRELFARLSKAAQTASSVLIRGETGTGKELIARAIHEASPRAGKPFVVVDCAALTDTLFQSELFGHAKGAFTGAHDHRAGAFETAEGGTVFLDEVGELTPSMQPKLLRVLESRTIQRVGETKARPVDVRVISATHRDLEEMINCAAFREDLFFRIAVLPVRVPAVRERRADIPPLLARMLPPDARKTVDPALLLKLAAMPWMGNVRELRNFAERLAAFGPEEAMTMIDGRGRHAAPSPASPPDKVDADEDLRGPFKAFKDRLVERGERAYLEALLVRHDRNVAQAAEEAEVDRTYLYRLMRRYGL